VMAGILEGHCEDRMADRLPFWSSVGQPTRDNRKGVQG